MFLFWKEGRIQMCDSWLSRIWTAENNSTDAECTKILIQLQIELDVALFS